MKEDERNYGYQSFFELYKTDKSDFDTSNYIRHLHLGMESK